MDTKRKKIWPSTLLAMKKAQEKISVITAYDFPTATLVEEAGIHVVLVGDSLGNVIAGLSDTLPVTMDQMVYHTLIVKRGLSHSLLVADMPYMSYHVSRKDAVINAGRLVKESGARAVKLEGGREVLSDILPALKRAQLPVMGHLGLTPQSVNKFGGFKIQGKDKSSQERILEDALFLQDQGCFSIVLEGVPEELGQKVTEALEIPTIGIGAGKFTDGQVLVFHDMLGYNEKPPKFVRKYADLRGSIIQGVQKYIDDVQKGDFPSKEETYD